MLILNSAISSKGVHVILVVEICDENTGFLVDD